jgi:hypothetical protein
VVRISIMEEGTRRGDFRFAATGIGSVPYLDVPSTCRMILDRFPRAPFWPQFPKRSFLEGMIVQYSEGLPMLRVDANEKTISYSGRDRAAELTRFYEHFLSDDVDYFALSREFAPGFYEMTDLLRANPGRSGPFVKGQSVGPVTFCMAVRDEEGKGLIHDPECLEALSRGLAIKALWQVRELGKLGRKTILFLDEPSLSGFGSAFTSLERDEVIRLLLEFMIYLRERCSVSIGIHCCGNTDWSMLLDAGPDIINFDAFAYLEYFLLYRDRIRSFLEAGGSIAWGIVPTGDQAGRASHEAIAAKLREGIDRLSGGGIDPDEIARASLLTPACGMGDMQEPAATLAMDSLRQLSERERSK